MFTIEMKLQAPIGAVHSIKEIDLDVYRTVGIETIAARMADELHCELMRNALPLGEIDVSAR